MSVNHGSFYGVYKTSRLFHLAHQHSLDVCKRYTCFSQHRTRPFPASSWGVGILYSHRIYQHRWFSSYLAWPLFQYWGTVSCVASPNNAPNVRERIPHLTWWGLFRCSTHNKIAQCLQLEQSAVHTVVLLLYRGNSNCNGIEVSSIKAGQLDCREGDKFPLNKLSNT